MNYQYDEAVIREWAQQIERVEARPVKNGYQVVAIAGAEEYVVKKSGALRAFAHICYNAVNGNGQEWSAHVQCAKKCDWESLIRSFPIEVAA